MKSLVRKDLLAVAFLMVVLTGFVTGFFISYTASRSSLQRVKNELPNTVGVDQLDIEPVDLNIDTSAKNVRSAADGSVLLGRECLLVFIKKYKECGHTMEETREVQELYQGLGLSEIQKKFEDWTILTFEEDRVVMESEFDGKCPEHYIVKLMDDKVVVFSESTNSIVKTTRITLKSLKSSDRERLKEGIKIETYRQLVQFMEDYGS